MHILIGLLVGGRWKIDAIIFLHLIAQLISAEESFLLLLREMSALRALQKGCRGGKVDEAPIIYIYSSFTSDDDGDAQFVFISMSLSSSQSQS